MPKATATARSGRVCRGSCVFSTGQSFCTPPRPQSSRRHWWFVRVLDRTTLLYPEYRGNGVLASLGNISENPHIGLIFIDFFEATIGLHVNGKARIVDNNELLHRLDLPLEVRQDMAVEGRRRAER